MCSNAVRDRLFEIGIKAAGTAIRDRDIEIRTLRAEVAAQKAEIERLKGDLTLLHGANDFQREEMERLQAHNRLLREALEAALRGSRGVHAASCRLMREDTTIGVSCNCWRAQAQQALDGQRQAALSREGETNEG